jgi:hypothetical protein
VSQFCYLVVIIVTIYAMRVKVTDADFSACRCRDGGVPAPSQYAPAARAVSRALGIGIGAGAEIRDGSDAGSAEADGDIAGEVEHEMALAVGRAEEPPIGGIGGDETVQERLGAARTRIVAVVGRMIGQPNYEVRPGLAEMVASVTPASAPRLRGQPALMPANDHLAPLLGFGGERN